MFFTSLVQGLRENLFHTIVIVLRGAILTIYQQKIPVISVLLVILTVGMNKSGAV
jgi:hypothetical protein